MTSIILMGLASGPTIKTAISVLWNKNAVMYQSLVFITRRLIKMSYCRHNHNTRQHVSANPLFVRNEVNTAVWLKVHIFWGVCSVDWWLMTFRRLVFLSSSSCGLIGIKLVKMKRGFFSSQNTTSLWYVLYWRYVSALTVGHLQVTRHIFEDTIQCDS